MAALQPWPALIHGIFSKSHSERCAWTNISFFIFLDDIHTDSINTAVYLSVLGFPHDSTEFCNVICVVTYETYLINRTYLTCRSLTKKVKWFQVIVWSQNVMGRGITKQNNKQLCTFHCRWGTRKTNTLCHDVNETQNIWFIPSNTRVTNLGLMCSKIRTFPELS